MSESRPRVIIAGSGLAGLVCATDLALEAEVVLFERLPVVGGADWELSRISALGAYFAAVGGTAICGTQALRWEPGCLFAAGMAGGVYSADLLVVATGHRPATAAEWGLGGVRCGGVMAGTVAHHLLASGVLPGHRPVVLGDTRLARSLARELLNGGAREVIRVAPGCLPTAPTEPGIRIEDAQPLVIHGGPRIDALEVVTPSGDIVKMPCDALVLAGQRLPYRNVDGALEASGTVVMAQCEEDEDSDEATEQAGHDAASRVRRQLRMSSGHKQCRSEAM